MRNIEERLTPEQKQMARRRRILQGRAAQGTCIFAALLVISLLFGGTLAFGQDKTFSDSENRMLAQRPEITGSSEKYSKLRPQSGLRWMFMPGASQRSTRYSPISVPTARPISSSSAGSNEQASSDPVGKAVQY